MCVRAGDVHTAQFSSWKFYLEKELLNLKGLIKAINYTTSVYQLLLKESNLYFNCYCLYKVSCFETTRSEMHYCSCICQCFWIVLLISFC